MQRLSIKLSIGNNSAILNSPANFPKEREREGGKEREGEGARERKSETEREPHAHIHTHTYTHHIYTLYTHTHTRTHTYTHTHIHTCMDNDRGHVGLVSNRRYIVDSSMCRQSVTEPPVKVVTSWHWR